jgi:hypothetical protein
VYGYCIFALIRYEMPVKIGNFIRQPNWWSGFIVADFKNGMIGGMGRKVRHKIWDFTAGLLLSIVPSPTFIVPK